MHKARPPIPHYGDAGKGLRLKEGMTITIEPMVNTGVWKSKMDDNGWTARTKDGESDVANSSTQLPGHQRRRESVDPTKIRQGLEEGRII